MPCIQRKRAATLTTVVSNLDVPSQKHTQDQGERPKPETLDSTKSWIEKKKCRFAPKILAILEEAKSGGHPSLAKLKATAQISNVDIVEKHSESVIQPAILINLRSWTSTRIIWICWICGAIDDGTKE